MITEQAIIVGTEGEWAWVESAPAAACQGCESGTGCGVAALGRFFSARQKPVKVYNPLRAGLREQVSIGLPASALLTGSFAVYMVPLVLMFVFALAARSIGHGLQLAEAVTTVAGMAGLATGFAWLRLFSRRMKNDRRYQPVVIGKLSHPNNREF